VSEHILEEIGRLSASVLKEDSMAKEAIDGERAAKRLFLELMVQAVREALPAIASKGMFGGIYRPQLEKTVLLGERKKGAEALHLREDGQFVATTSLGASGSRGASTWSGEITVDEVVDQRWNVAEMAENLADELQANLTGKLKVVSRADEITAKVRAVSVLLKS
jgi:hypothetical protein